MLTYPVQVQITARPLYYDRMQLLVRVVLALALAAIGITAGWLAWIAFLVLPIVAAIASSARGATWYVADLGPRLWRVLTWLLGVSAYMLLVVDRFPTRTDDVLRTELQVDARPTVGSAMLRIVTSIPSALVLAVLTIVAYVMWIVGAIAILADRTVPASVIAFLSGVVRWQARLLAYHASLVDEYPPFSFETAPPRRHVTAA
jgi:hypothetical protein